MTHYYQSKFMPVNKHKYKGDLNNIWSRSSWEYFYFSKLDRNALVIEWSSEEIIIPYISPKDGKCHRYFPDCYFAEKTSRGIERYIVEIKPKSQTKPPKVPKRKTKKYLNEIMTYSINAAKWEAARQYCDKMGFKFIIATEKEVGVTWQ